MDERERWNARYASRVNTHEEEPHPFLREHLALLPRGRALELAMGEGHDAIFLARQGFSVTGLDVSDIAVERSLRMSQVAGVAIEVHCTDLRTTTTTLPADTYDVVVCFYYLQRDLFPQVVNTLRTGGIVIYETFTGEQARYGHPTNPDYLLRPNELLEAFRALRIRVYRDLIVQGPKAVASLVGEKVSHR
ncbi:MAG: class I SAM-dependent methyltransferase [Candidatus Entotheonellia bacterium]